jgi:hypothetical protein
MMNVEGHNGSFHIDPYLEWGRIWKMRFDMILLIKGDGLIIRRDSIPIFIIEGRSSE